MKKKVIAIVVLLVIVVSAVVFSLSKKDNTSKTNAKKTDFKVKSAFADVDTDMIIENNPKEDADKKYDYIFITFTSEVMDTKKEDSSNPLNLKNYTFDNNSLPKGTVISLKNPSLLVIELPDGYLKGINAPHSFKLSKDLKNKNGENINGTLEIKLPYSVPSASNLDKQPSSSSKNKKDTTSDNSQKNDGKKSDTKASGNSEKTTNTNADMPKFTVKTIDTIPQTTIVAVTLDSPNPENYKVSVAGTALQLKTNDKGEKIFANSIDKEYSFDEVSKLVKIEKVK